MATQLGLITLLTLGAVALFLVTPGGRVRGGWAKLIVTAGVVAILLAAVLSHVQDQFASFIPLAIIGVFGAVRVITQTKPVYCALHFILVALSVAGMLILMHAEFIGIALVIVYGGAILVTYVFVIMLAQDSDGPRDYDREAREPFLGVLTGFILLAVLSARLIAPEAAAQSAVIEDPVGGDFASVGTHLLTQYVVGVQIAGVLLLAAMVGAVAIARRRDAQSEGTL